MRRRGFLAGLCCATGVALTGLTGAARVGGTDTDTLWTVQTGGEVRSSPTVVDGTVFVGSANEQLYAIDAETGEGDWALDTGAEIYSAPTVIDDAVFFSTGGNQLASYYAVDTDGDVHWTADGGTYAPTSPAAVDGTVIGVSELGVAAWDAESGAGRWQSEPTQVMTSVTVADGTVFAGYRRGHPSGFVYAVDLASGEVQWSFKAHWVLSTPTVSGETVFAGSKDNSLYAIDVDSGDERWSFEAGGSIDSSPTVADGTVYVGSHDTHLYAVDAESGAQRWSFVTGDSVYSSPTTVDGTVFVGSQDGCLYAIDRESGDEQWRFETGDSVISSPIVVDGTAFVGSSDGTVYALDAQVSGSSDGSRTSLGSLGHHDDWTYADQQIDLQTSEEAGDSVDTDEGSADGSDADDSGPGFGVGAVAGGICGAGYLLRRRLTEQPEP